MKAKPTRTGTDRFLKVFHLVKQTLKTKIIEPQNIIKFKLFDELARYQIHM